MIKTRNLNILHLPVGAKTSPDRSSFLARSPGSLIRFITPNCFDRSKDRNLKQTENNLSLNLSDTNSSWNPQLGFYLAGLIEGDGNIWTSKTLKSPKGRINNPQITFTFHIKERAFFKKNETGF